METIAKFAGGSIELRLGRWQSVLSDVTTCDAVITDPPYSERTHSGNSDMRERFGSAARQSLGYQALDENGVAEFVARFSGVDGWVCSMTDDDLAPCFRNTYRRSGRYAFAPVPILAPRVRLCGDGPASAAVYLMVSRPTTRRFLSWGALPGWYEAGIDRVDGIIGNKPLDLMRAIVRDYSRPGDLVVDPYAGGATTALACAIDGRRCISAECDPATFALAVKRLERGHTPDMFATVKDGAA